jgi:hypothetical protein
MVSQTKRYLFWILHSLGTNVFLVDSKRVVPFLKWIPIRRQLLSLEINEYIYLGWIRNTVNSAAEDGRCTFACDKSE